jgi:hypothetical protein
LRLAAQEIAMRLIAILAAALLVLPLGCKREDQPAETGTRGNATDRSVDGTSGTGEPAAVSTGTAAAATSLDTIAPSSATSGTAPALTGTQVVHGAKNETTATLQGADGTATVARTSPAGTTATTSTTKH